MVMKTYFKTLKRMFRKNFTKLLSISFILLISIGLVFGVGSSTSKVNQSVLEYYQDQNVSDLIIKSTKKTGFTEEEINIIKHMYNQVMLGTSFDIEANNEVTRYYYYDLTKIYINKLELLEGKIPSQNNEILVERKTSKLKNHHVGDIIDYNGNEYTITGIVKNPLYFQNLEEPSYINDKDLNNIFYFNTDSYLPINEIYISFDDNSKLNNMDDSYKDFVNQEVDKIENELNNITILSLYDNVSFFKLFTLTDKITIISLILLIGFIFVSALVVLSTMSRLVEEERSKIACLKTLGYSNFIIIFKYLIFAFISTVIGGLFAYFVGLFITDLIYYNFDAFFEMPVITKKISNFHYILTLLILVLSTLIVTFNASYQMVRKKPAEIFQTKSPVKGKKIILEKIPFIWKKLSFKYKSTFRNLFRYKKHFLMTVVSISGSTILVFLAIGLLSYSLIDELLGDALIFICTVILLFAGLLTILVIYTLTNINISERYKEISTLMVLGYYDREVTGYIYREIYLMCLIGIIVGLPLGHICLNGVFELLEFGSMSDVGLYVYFITPLAVIIFTILITLILRKKITNINIHESLKANE